MRARSAVWLLVLVACGGEAAQTASSFPAPSHSRIEVTERLCELLPDAAEECVVSWPSSVPPRHRAEAMSVSEAGPLAGTDSPVRAYASCVDRSDERGVVARVSVLLLSERPQSREELAAALPIGVRWEGEPCEDERCALPIARLDGDRLVLTRRTWAPREGSPDLARIACGAVRDGAVEARARRVGQGASVRELRADDAGVELRVRRRPGTDDAPERFDWTELGLRLVDAEISREAAARAAEATQVVPIESLDLSNEETIDLQVAARERRLRRRTSPEALRDLAALYGRGFAAHPSRTDLGEHGVERALEAGWLDQAEETLALLASLVGRTSPMVRRHALSLALARGDEAAVRRELSEAAPDLAEPQLAVIATELAASRGDDPLDSVVSLRLEHAARGLVALSRSASTALPALPAARRGDLTLRGTPAAIAVLAECPAPDAVVVCGPSLDEHRALRRVVTPAGTLTLVRRGPCVAGVSAPTTPTELAHLVGELRTEMAGTVTISLVCGTSVVGLGGTASERVLHVERASTRLAHVDLARVERWLARPFGAHDGRVFPAPTLTLPITPEESERALAATRGIEGVRCAMGNGALDCSGELAVALAALYSSFAD